MSNIVEPQITETKPTKWINDLLITSNTGVVGGSDFAPKPQKSNQQQAQLELAKQQALMQEMTPYSGLTGKVFGKESNFVSGGGNRFIILPTYIIVGAVVGRYVAKNMKKSTTLGMVLGGLAPLLAYQLSIEYDKKNMPKQEPKQKVGMNPDGSIMTEKQIANTQVSSDISKFIPKNEPTPYMPQVKPSGLGFNLNCPNGTKKETVPCLVAPCPEMEVCA